NAWGRGVRVIAVQRSHEPGTFRVASEMARRRPPRRHAPAARAVAFGLRPRGPRRRPVVSHFAAARVPATAASAGCLPPRYTGIVMTTPTPFSVVASGASASLALGGGIAQTFAA